MTKGTHKNWTFWRSRIFAQGEGVAMLLGSNSFPIPLKKIAEKRKVRNVIFRPLLVDGCLTVTDEGFNIYVHCEKENSQKAASKFEVESNAGTLHPRMRFTIAHELAHTFFFDITEGRPRNRLKGENQNTIRTLETVCSQAAARILLPTDMVRAEVKTIDLYSPAALRQFSQKAAVSPQMLVNRLGEVYHHLRGIGGFAYAERNGVTFQLTALKMHSSLRGVFPKAKLDAAVSNLISNPDFVLNGGEKFEETVVVSYKSTYSTFNPRFRFACEDSSSLKSRKGVFITFERLE
jgi:hypothetical protein